MQVDATSEFARQVLPVLLAVPAPDAAGRALALLNHWDGTMAAGLPQPLLFNAWMRRFEGAVLAKADAAPLGPWTDFVAFVLSPAGARWCDGDCPPVLAKALRETVADLAARFGSDPATWRWGAAHEAVFSHPLLRSIGAARIEQPGDDTTVFRGGSGRDGFDSVHGPGFRGVYDLADLDRSLFVAVPGQSGNPFRPISRSMLARWRDGAGVPIGPVPARTEATLRLSP